MAVSGRLLLKLIDVLSKARRLRRGNAWGAWDAWRKLLQYSRQALYTVAEGGNADAFHYAYETLLLFRLISSTSIPSCEVDPAGPAYGMLCVAFKEESQFGAWWP